MRFAFLILATFAGWLVGSAVVGFLLAAAGCGEFPIGLAIGLLGGCSLAGLVGAFAEGVAE